MIYCEEDDERHVPILIVEHDGKVLIELRSYYDGQKRGAIWHTITWDQARLLRDKLSEWLIENPKRCE